MATSIDEIAGQHAKAREHGIAGLAAVCALSLVSFAAMLMSLASIGHLGDWTKWQFAGLFGVIETAAGLAAIVTPNVWRLPVAQVNLPRTEIELTASTVLIPHWSSAGRVLAGLLTLGASAINTSVGASTLALLPFLLILSVVYFELSTLLAYFGVRNTDLDVIQFAVRRAGKEAALPPLSISASVLHFLLNIMVVPIVYFVSSAVLYGPELRVTTTALAVVTGLALLLGAAAAISWRSRSAWQAKPVQQHEAESTA